MTNWLCVAVEHEGVAGEVTEVPLEGDGTLLLTSLTSQYDKAQGLRYRNEHTGAYRAVRCTDGKLHPPDGGWGVRTYLVVEKAAPAAAAPAKSGATNGEATSVKRPADDMSLDDARKRSKSDNCFRCGGTGHIAHMCTSPWDSKNDASAQECYGCHGRGHMKNNCPSNIPKGTCYKCLQYGHQGRNCPGIGRGQSASGVDYGYGGSYDAYGMMTAAYGQTPMPGVPGMPAAPGQQFGGAKLCFRCQQPGHNALQCPRTREQGVSVDSCFKCGLEGHRAKDCSNCIICKTPGHVAATCPARR